jgi:hypothetical protein
VLKVRIEMPRAFEVEKIESQLDPGTGEGRIEITPFVGTPRWQPPVAHLFVVGTDGVTRGWQLYIRKGEQLSLVRFGAKPEEPAPEEHATDAE